MEQNSRAISFSARVSVPPDVLVSELAGETVILSLKTERYYGLDEVGTRMWNLLTGMDSIQTAYQALLGEYEVDAEQLRQDLTDLVEKLVEQGLVELHDTKLA